MNKSIALPLGPHERKAPGQPNHDWCQWGPCTPGEYAPRKETDRGMVHPLRSNFDVNRSGVDHAQHGPDPQNGGPSQEVLFFRWHLKFGLERSTKSYEPYSRRNDSFRVISWIVLFPLIYVAFEMTGEALPRSDPFL